MHVSCETRRQTHERLSKVLGAARMKVLAGTYAFVESPLSRPPEISAPDTLAWVRDDEVWSQLAPSCDTSRELFTIFRFHFEDGLDNSGFVGWLASHLKARVGTGVFVVCGQNSRRGGIFDYWGCPARVTAQVLDEIEHLAFSAATSDQSRSDAVLDGVRMRVVATGAQGQIGAGTILEFEQRGATVAGQYAGGKIRVGQLVGTLEGNNLEFRFAQVDEEGLLHGGRSRCEIERLADGRLRLVEHFQWESRAGSGTNVLEELED